MGREISMTTATIIRRVPWTCRWGRFGGPVPATPAAPAPGFVFWVCAHPESNGPKVLDHGSCDECVRWEPLDELKG
jgi:hypothetical protein